MPGKAIRFEELNWPAFEKIEKERCVFFITLGPLEEHGPHLPLATDPMNAERITELMAEGLSSRHPGWTFLLSPTLTLGDHTLQKPGSITIRQRVVRDLLVDYGLSLVRWGVRNIVVSGFHGGMGHNSAIEEACRRVRGSRAARRIGASMIYPTINQGERIMRGELNERFEEKLGRPLAEAELGNMARDNHAGFLETGAILNLRPEIVDRGFTILEPFLPGFLEAGGFMFGPNVGRGAGYFGLPHLASAEIGRAYQEIVAEEAADLVRRMMMGEDVTKECENTFYKIGLFRTGARPLAAAFGLLYRTLEPTGLWKRLDRALMARMFGEEG